MGMSIQPHSGSPFQEGKNRINLGADLPFQLLLVGPPAGQERMHQQVSKGNTKDTLRVHQQGNLLRIAQAVSFDNVQMNRNRNVFLYRMQQFHASIQIITIGHNTDAIQ